MRLSSSAQPAQGPGPAGETPADSCPDSLDTLLPHLACPACLSSDLVVDASVAIYCPQCETQFPAFRCGRSLIPWLFARPDTARLEWKARYNGFLQANAAEQARLKNALGESRNSLGARRRINRLLKGRKQHREQVTRLIAPLSLRDIDWPTDATELLHDKLPRSQGLSSYTANVFRDWAWDNGENEAMLNAVDRVLRADVRDDVGTMLTLGAGACRLPFDMHRRYSPRLSVAADINPLLLQIASEVISGKTVTLNEFPVAPLNEASFASQQNCRAPDSGGAVNLDNFLFVLADATNPPFAMESFDTVVTPWIIDILPQDLRELIPRINQLIPVGGVWVNTGSLAFLHREASWCYSEEEVLSLVEENGFEILSMERQTVQHLQSPLSGRGRTENVLSFCARKYDDAGIPQTCSYLPGWITDTSQPVPTSADLVASSSSHLLSAQVLSTIDGKRTINQISRAVASQYGLGTPETIHAVKRILVDAWEENCFEEPDDGV